MKAVLTFLALISFLNIMSSQRLIDEIKSHHQGVGLWWIGHNAWVIKYQDLVICTDLLLEYDKRAKAPPITVEELGEILDISFITHGHKDHFNRISSKWLADSSDCLFVMPSSCLPIAQELGIPDQKITVAYPRMPFDILGIHIEPLRAIHGNANFAIYYDANLEDCGYIINIGGKRFLQPGDTHLLEDHLFCNDIDVLFFSPTEHNMYIYPSIILINRLEPSYILPQHHSTVIVNDETRFWAKGYQEEVRIRLNQSLQKNYHILNPGDFLLIE